MEASAAFVFKVYLLFWSLHAGSASEQVVLWDALNKASKYNSTFKLGC